MERRKTATPGAVQQLAPGYCLVMFGDGQQHWIDARWSAGLELTPGESAGGAPWVATDLPPCANSETVAPQRWKKRAGKVPFLEPSEDLRPPLLGRQT